MKRLSEQKWFNRLLEIIPGALAWSILLLPFILAPLLPKVVAYFVLAFTLYWFVKSLNMMKNLFKSFPRLWRNMKIDWLKRCESLSKDPEMLLKQIETDYKNNHNRRDLLDYEELNNLEGHHELIKNWEEVYHLVIIANYKENFDILETTFDALAESNYPNDRLIILLAGEGREKKDFLARRKEIEEKYSGVFNALIFNVHEDNDGEVKGKGSNLYSASKKIRTFMSQDRPQISPDNVLVTTLDADHLVHREYFGRLTYKYIIDPNRDRKTYQPVPLLFNNIWDAPAPNRIAAISSSFFQMIEAVRPFRLRTFAAHTQSLQTLLITDFWSNQTIVEDGHQYWRTYFAYNGDHEMVALFIPVYQDCVLASTKIVTFKNQYLQMRRWAWGISDFPFVVKEYMRHPEISFGEKFLQVFRLFSGHFSWSTASFLLAFAWLPLLFNNSFQDTVLAHNVTYFSSLIMNLAWVSLIANVWCFFLLLPPRPKNSSKTKYIGLALQWFLIPVVALFFSAIPALESQTRLMLGKKLDVFWVTPKVRKSEVSKNK